MSTAIRGAGPCEKSNGFVVSITTLSVMLLGPAVCKALAVPVREVRLT
ncbi:MAG: hypothetical protein WBV84_14675 [Nitrososphaeraceae archaeon]